MRDALERHDRIVQAAIAEHGGYVFATGGDGFAAAFGRAGDLIAASARAQAALGREDWPSAAPIRVRMAVHTGRQLLRPPGQPDGAPDGRRPRRPGPLLGGDRRARTRRSPARGPGPAPPARPVRPPACLPGGYDRLCPAPDRRRRPHQPADRPFRADRSATRRRTSEPSKPTTSCGPMSKRASARPLRAILSLVAPAPMGHVSTVATCCHWSANSGRSSRRLDLRSCLRQGTATTRERPPPLELPRAHGFSGRW